MSAHQANRLGLDFFLPSPPMTERDCEDYFFDYLQREAAFNVSSESEGVWWVDRYGDAGIVVTFHTGEVFQMPIVKDPYNARDE